MTCTFKAEVRHATLTLTEKSLIIPSDCSVPRDAVFAALHQSALLLCFHDAAYQLLQPGPAMQTANSHEDLRYKVLQRA